MKHTHYKHISPFFKFGMRGYEQDLLYKSDLFSEYFFEKKNYSISKELDISSIILTNEIQKLLHLENIFIDHLFNNSDNIFINIKQHK